jgi:hypothetical protein
MDVFDEYKPMRNKIASLAVDDALGVIWTYCQYLQIDNFIFPKEIEILDSFLQEDTSFHGCALSRPSRIAAVTILRCREIGA